MSFYPRISAALETDDGMAQQKMSVPWRSFVTSVPLIALVTSDVCNTFAAIIFFSYLPTYVNSMLGFDIKGSHSDSDLNNLKICHITIGRI